MISVKVLLFSVLREKLERDSLDVTLDASAPSGSHLLDILSETHTSVKAYRNVIRLAVNESYVNEAHLLKEGDVVALITPVSGG